MFLRFCTPNGKMTRIDYNVACRFATTWFIRSHTSDMANITALNDHLLKLCIHCISPHDEALSGPPVPNELKCCRHVTKYPNQAIVAPGRDWLPTL